MLDDWELLRHYTDGGSDDAFRTLLDRHVNLVFSAALRQVGDRYLAQEVTQAVFIVLAHKAHSLRPGTLLVGWLFRTTRFIAARAARDHHLRQKREQEAALMEHCLASPEPPSTWDDAAPVLDDAIAGLGETDRHAVLLRFFERKEMKEVGHVLGTSEDAAKKRVGRAVEKLRAFLVRRGIVMSAAALAGALLENSTQAAPAGLSASTFTAITTNTGTAGSLALAQSALTGMLQAKLKLAALLGAALLACIGTGFVLHASLTGRNPALGTRYFPLRLEGVDGMKLVNFPRGKLWDALPTGSKVYGGIPFEMGMRVQLHGNQDSKEFRRYPARVMGIPVRRPLARLHIVQGGNINERDGTPMAAFIVHYANGSNHTALVIYGVHTRAWWHYPAEAVSEVTDTNSLVVWTGRSGDGDRQGATHRIYRTTFELPACTEAVESIDCVSLFSRSSLILLAMTGEAGPARPTAPSHGVASADIARFKDSLDLVVTDERGQAVKGARVLGLALTRGGDITLGKLDDAFSAPGLVPIDFPTGAHELQLRVSARGYQPAEIRLSAAKAGRFAARPVVPLRMASAQRRGAEPGESREEARAASESIQAAYDLKRTGRHAEAVTAFLLAARRFPRHSDTFHGLAQALRESGNPVRALPQHDRAITLEPGRDALYWERGLTHMRMRCFDDAIDDFETCLALNPGFEKARVALVKAFESRDRIGSELSDTEFIQSVRSDPPRL